jgi:hypothetical protein
MGQRVRNRVLGCLPSSELVTAEAKQLLISRDEDESTATKLEANEHWDQDEPDVMIRDATDDPEPQGLDRQVLQSIVQYIESRPATLETNRALDIQSELAVLRAELSSDNVRDLPTHRHEQAWGRLAEACKLIASQPDLRCDDSLGAFVRSILLEAVEYPSRPEPDGNYDSEYVMVPTCKPRAEAAEGLLWLAAHSTFLDSVTLDVIEGLADDPDPAVRLQIAAKVNLLAASAPKLVWSVLERLGAEERLPGLLHLMVCGPLLAVSRLDADRAAAIARAVYERQSDEEEDFVRNDCVSVFLDLYLRFDHESSRDVLFAIANSAVEHPGEVAHIARHLRAALTAGPVVPAEPFAEAVRARAFGLLEAVLRSAEEINRRLREAMRAGQSNPPSELERHHIEALMKISGTISQEVYFASGAYAERHEDDGDRVSDEVKHRFLREAGPVLDKLGGFGFPQTAHSLLETLDAYVAMDPMGVFERVGRVVCVSREYGYQYEQLANNLVVGLVQRYLASYPADVRQNTASQSTLIEILDTFTDVGWPSALRLAYQLEQIYR